MNAKFVLAAILSGMVCLSACNNAKKNTADMAIKGAQTAYAEIADEANEYVPDQSREVRNTIQSAKNTYDNGDYAAAFEASRTLPVKVKDLRTATEAKRNELTASWKDLSDTVPELVSEVQEKIDALAKRHRLSKAVSASLESAKQNWLDASEAFTSGQIPAALSKGSAAKSQLTELEAKLKIKPAA